MDIKKLQALVVDALEDIKAQDIRVYDTTQLTSLFDRLAIASGTSNRQTKALAASVRDKIKENGGTIVSMEGEDTGEWVLVDLGDMIVHIMQPAIRDYYRLEEIWGEKEVKLGAAKRTSKRTASETAEDEAPKKRGRHLTVNRATAEADEAPKKSPARKTAAKTASKTAAKTATKTASKTAAKSTGTAAKSATAKTAAPRKTAAKTVSKSAGTKIKVATRKTPAKKAPAKRAE
jgi:ribosome-associated protein